MKRLFKRSYGTDQMSLRLRVFLVVLSAAIISVVSLYLISNYFIMKSYIRLEQQETIRNITRMRAAYTNEISVLNKISVDYANWDAAYHFIQEPDQAFIETNLTESTLQNLGVDNILFYDLELSLVGGRSLHPDTGQKTTLPDDIPIKRLENDTSITTPKKDALNSGLLQTSRGPLLVSMQYIHKSNQQDPPTGIILVGKYLNQKVIQEWNQLAQLSLDFAILDHSPLPVDYQTALENLEKSEQNEFIQLLDTPQGHTDTEYIAGYTLIKDLFGNNLVLLRVDEPRNIYLQGLTSLRTLIAILLIVTLIISVLTYLYFDRKISRKLLSIMQGFNRFRETHDFSLSIPVYGKDEFANLAIAANETIAEIGHYEESLLKSERQFREVLQKLRLIAIITDKEGKITFCNDHFLKLTGWYRYELLGQDWFDLFIPEEEREHRRRSYFKSIGQGDDHNPHSESYMLVRNGEKKLIAWNNTFLRDNADNLVGMARIGEDITLDRQKEQKIRQSLEETRLHLSRLTTLRKIDSAISSKQNMHEKLQAVARTIKESLGVDSVVILIIEPVTKALIPTAAVGDELALIPPLNLCDGNGELNKISENDEVLIFTDLNSRKLPEWLAVRYREYCPYTFYAAAPMIIAGNQIGILETFAKRTPNHDPGWATYLQSLALQTAIAFDNAEMVQRIQQANRDLVQAYEATLKGWASALELRDKETSGHSERMMDLASRLGVRMGVKNTQLANLSRGVLLHDIGKMGIPDYILHKPGPLTDDQWSVMRKHPQFAYDLLRHVPYLNGALEVPYCHHERWDGSGYPRGLKGEEIPLNARIFAIIDVWDALTHDRPYRAAWSTDETMQYILDAAGSHFDPEVVNNFLRLIREDHPELLSDSFQTVVIEK